MKKLIKIYPNIIVVLCFVYDGVYINYNKNYYAHIITYNIVNIVLNNIKVLSFNHDSNNCNINKIPINILKNLEIIIFECELNIINDIIIKLNENKLKQLIINIEAVDIHTYNINDNNH